MSTAGESHLSADQLEGLVNPAAGVFDGQGPAAHLLEGCTRCVGELRRRLAETNREAARVTVRAILEEEEPRTELLGQVASRVRAWELLLEAEIVSAPALAEELLRLPAQERLETARHSRRYRSLELCRHMAQVAREEVFRDPGQAIELGRLAVEITHGLEAAGYPPGIATDVRALCWGALGNGFRVASDLFEAERALRSATAFVEEGTGHPLVRADVASLLGSLRMVQTRYEEAREILEVAYRIYREFGGPIEEGKILVKLGDAMAEAGRRDQAIEVLGRARNLLKPGEPRLALFAGHSRAVHLNNAGRSKEAWELFLSLEEEYDAHGLDFRMRQRRRWLEARLLAAGSDVDRAEDLLWSVRGAFAEREASYEFAMVTLELSTLLLSQGRVEGVRKLAEELIPIFSSRQVHRHALAALALFQNSVASNRITLETVHELIHYLRRARNNPYLPYSGSA